MVEEVVTREDKLGLEEGAYLEIWLGGWGGSWKVGRAKSAGRKTYPWFGGRGASGTGL